MPIVGLRIVSWTPIVNTKEKIMPKTTKRNVDDRNGIIGGSSLGAMLGLSKYQSKHDVWLSWKGEERKVTDKQQEIFDMGHALEDFIAKQAEKKYGEIDIFFSNAGIGRGGHEDATDKDWADSWY